jgi:succinate dehydrogenase / fumarate reductase membrane anchor subunit
MRESTLWRWHMLAGAVVFFLLGLHMVIMHLDDILLAIGVGHGKAIDATIVFERSQQAFFMLTYIILLGAALYHGLYGMRNILFELTLKKGWETIINWIFIVVGLGLFIYGTYAAIFVFLNGEV